MAIYDLLEEQRKVLREMVAVYHETKVSEFFCAPAYGGGTFVEFSTTSGPRPKVECTIPTLQVLCDEGLINLRYDRHDTGTRLYVETYQGSLKQSALDAVAAGFHKPVQAPTIGQAGQVVLGDVTNSTMQTAIGNHNILHITKTTDAEVIKAIASVIADLKPLVRETLPKDEADAAETDLRELETQISSAQPDKGVLYRRVKAIGRKCVDAVDWSIGTLDSAATRAEKLGGAVTKIGGLIALLGQLHGPQR